jgi:hypothetical protein
VRGPVHHLLDELREAGLDLIEADTTDYAAACAGFVEAVTQGLARYPYPQPELSDAVADARKQTLGDRWKWGRRTSESADISPIVAASLAVWGSLEHHGTPEVISLGEVYAQMQAEGKV